MSRDTQFMAYPDADPLLLSPLDSRWSRAVNPAVTAVYSRMRNEAPIAEKAKRALATVVTGETDPVVKIGKKYC